MRIVDLLSKESILLNASPASKQEALLNHTLCIQA